MVALQIRDVPEDVRDALAARAKARGQSLQKHLLALVIAEAASPQVNAAILDQVEGWRFEAGSATRDRLLSVMDEGRSARGVRTTAGAQ